MYTGNIFTGAGVKIDVILDKTPQTWVPSATYTSGGHANPRMSKLVFKNQNTADPDRPYTFEFPLCEWIEIRMEQRIDNAGDYIETLSVRTNAVGNATESPEVLYTVANPTPLEIMLDDIWLGKGVTPTGKFKNFNFYSDECEVDKANYGGGGGCVPQTTTTLPPATAPTVVAPKQPNANYIPDPNWALAYLAGADLPNPAGGTHKPAIAANVAEADRNLPEWFATAEPKTYKTLTPWLNWADGLRAYRNCSEFQQNSITNPGSVTWTNLDEFRCQLLRGVALNGPTAVELTSDINQDFHKQQILCTQEMVDNKDVNCPQLNCCLGNCDPCFSDDGCTCAEPCPLKLCKTKVPLKPDGVWVNLAETHQINVSADGSTTNGWEEIG